MNVMAPRPIATTDDTVTLSRAEWERHLDLLEEAADRDAVRQDIAKRERLGESGYRQLSYSAQEVSRMLDGVSPIVILRERLGIAQKQLAATAKISPSYLAEIEGGKKPGSIAAVAAIAKALGVPIEHLVDAG